VNALVSALADPDREVRVAAVTTLGRTGDPRAVGALLRSLRDPEARIRVFAGTALRKLGWRKTNEEGETTAWSPAPIDATSLLDGMNSPDLGVRVASAHALSLQGDASHSAWFLPLLENEQFELRVAAANYFGRLKDPHFAFSLMPLMADENADVRAAAACALGHLRNPAAIDSLVAALLDEGPAVRQAAEAALEKIDPAWVSSESVRKASAKLKHFLNDPRPWVNSAAANLLSKVDAARNNVSA
jgi:HEAT repeat protein